MREALRILRPFWPLAMWTTSVGILSGLATAWLLATINEGLHGEITYVLLARFVGLCLLSVGGTAIAGIGNSSLGQSVIAHLRKDIAARISRAPIAVVEAYRSHRLMSVLTGDVETISTFSFNVSGYAIALATAVGSFIYLLALSPVVFLLSLVSLGGGIVISATAQRGWIRDYEGVRVAQDELYKQYRAVTEGAKELKMSRPRRGRVHHSLLSGAVDQIAALKRHAMRLHWLANAGSSATFFAVIGILLIGRSRFGLDAEVIGGAAIVLLYVKGPVEQIAAGLPLLDQARIAFTRIIALTAEVDEAEPDFVITARPPQAAIPEFLRSIRLEGVAYSFPAREGLDTFSLGPLDLTIGRGEILFVVGENGAGKTTLLKILLGLYTPQLGAVLLDDTPVTAERRDDYRQLFTTIFSDCFIFDDLPAGASPEVASTYLTRLDLAHKVAINGDRFSTTDLSAGQRKRLTLVQAYLEDRPIIVTDEWAADQDPDFRRVFYEDLLPELKARGKTLVVISHDDRYFHVADRVVRLSHGALTEDAHSHSAGISASSRQPVAP